MTNKMIAVLPFSATKTEEVEHLKSLAELQEEGTYISFLFTDELIDWFEGQISKDMGCDLHHTMVTHRNLALARLEEIERLEDALQGLNTSAENMASQIAQQREDMKGLRENRDEWTLYATNLEREAMQRDEAHRREVDSLKLEIMRLKAELYDRMVAEDTPTCQK